MSHMSHRLHKSRWKRTAQSQLSLTMGMIVDELKEKNAFGVRNLIPVANLWSRRLSDSAIPTLPKHFGFGERSARTCNITCKYRAPLYIKVTMVEDESFFDKWRRVNWQIKNPTTLESKSKVNESKYKPSASESPKTNDDQGISHEKLRAQLTPSLDEEVHEFLFNVGIACFPIFC